MQVWLEFVYNKYKTEGSNPESLKIYLKENPVQFDRIYFSHF